MQNNKVINLNEMELKFQKKMNEYENSLPRKSDFTKLYKNINKKNVDLLSLHKIINDFVKNKIQKSNIYSTRLDALKIDLFIAGKILIETSPRKSKIITIATYTEFMHSFLLKFMYIFNQHWMNNTPIMQKIKEIHKSIVKPMILDWFLCLVEMNPLVVEKIDKNKDYDLFLSEYYHHIDKQNIFMLAKTMYDRVQELQKTKIEFEIELNEYLIKKIENQSQKKEWNGTLQDFALYVERKKAQPKFKDFSQKYVYNIALKEYYVKDSKGEIITDHKKIVKALENWKRYHPTQDIYENY